MYLGEVKTTLHTLHTLHYSINTLYNLKTTLHNPTQPYIIR